ncbi:MAG: hypothetical protein U9N14_04265, partial [Pseudomonadota bacterium]|nr:hypothetical protein [Pseudomonadota bacterium]
VLVTSFICTILIIRFREKTWSAMAKAALAVVVALLIVSMMEFPLQNAATVSLFVASLGILARGKQMGKVRTLSVSEGGTVSLDVLARMLVLALFLVSVVQYNAALVNGRRKALYNIDSAEAFVASDRAATLWPVMTHYRARLYPTYVNWLFKALQDGSAFRYPILYDIAYAEKLYKTSLAAMPDYPAIGLARVRWLVIQDQAKTHKDEIETILADLKARAASNSALWVTEAFYAWKIGQTDRANDAIAKGRALPYLPGWDRTHLSSIEKTIGEDRL